MSGRSIPSTALDRIQELRTLEDLFVLPDDFDPQVYFADSFGVVVNRTCIPERVRIRFRIRVSGFQRKYIRTLPLHASQQETEITDESSVFEFHLRPTLDFQQGCSPRQPTPTSGLKY